MQGGGLSHEPAAPFVLTSQSTIGYGGRSWGDSRLGMEANVAEALPRPWHVGGPVKTLN